MKLWTADSAAGMRIWISSRYLGGRRRMQNWFFRMPKAHSITFHNIVCRKLTNSSLVDGLDLISSLRGLKHKGILPNVCAAPLSQMVPHTLVGDKQFTSVGVTKVTKDIFSLGNYQATSKHFFIHLNVRCWSFPSTKWIFEVKIKPAYEETILREKTFVVSIQRGSMAGWRYWNVTSINSPDNVLEVWPKLGVGVDLGGDWSIERCDESGVERSRGEDIRHFSEVSIENQLKWGSSMSHYLP